MLSIHSLPSVYVESGCSGSSFSKLVQTSLNSDVNYFICLQPFFYRSNFTGCIECIVKLITMILIYNNNNNRERNTWQVRMSAMKSIVAMSMFIQLGL